MHMEFACSLQSRFASSHSLPWISVFMIHYLNNLTFPGICFDKIVMPMFSSEPQFEPEPTRTGPRFGPRFKDIIEPNPRSRSRFREWTMGLNLSKPGSNWTFWVGKAGSCWVRISLKMIKCWPPSILKVESSVLMCTVSMMASILCAFSRIASVIYPFFCFWVRKAAKKAKKCKFQSQ